MSISVLVPAFNNVNYIKECIESVYVSGEGIEYELLIGIDNCPKTLKALENIPLNENTKIFYFEKHLGPYVIKNSLSEISKYEKLVFFDSDDIMLPNMLKYADEFIGDYDLVRFKMVNFRVKNNEIIEDQKRRAWGEGVFSIKKEIFMYHNGFENWKVAADSDFMGRLYKNNIKIKNSEEVMFYRRIHPDGLTSHPDTGFGSKLRQKYASISRQKRYFGPLEKMVTSECKTIDKNNIINYDLIKKSEMQLFVESKQGKIDILQKITSSEKNDNFTQPKNQIKYEVVNNVTQNRITQKSPYQNALLKINEVPHRHFPQQPSRKRF
jgi:glycosyltransferase involved in cell wall biosynthesis